MKEGYGEENFSENRKNNLYKVLTGFFDLNMTEILSVYSVVFMSIAND